MLSEIQKIYLENMARDFGLEEVVLYCHDCVKGMKRELVEDRKKVKAVKNMAKEEGWKNYQLNSDYELAKQCVEYDTGLLNNLKRVPVKFLIDVFLEVPGCDGGCSKVNKIVYVEIPEVGG